MSATTQSIDYIYNHSAFDYFVKYDKQYGVNLKGYRIITQKNKHCLNDVKMIRVIHFNISLRYIPKNVEILIIETHDYYEKKYKNKYGEKKRRKIYLRALIIEYSWGLYKNSLGWKNFHNKYIFKNLLLLHIPYISINNSKYLPDTIVYLILGEVYYREYDLTDFYYPKSLKYFKIKYSHNPIIAKLPYGLLEFEFFYKIITKSLNIAFLIYNISNKYEHIKIPLTIKKIDNIDVRKFAQLMAKYNQEKSLILRQIINKYHNGFHYISQEWLEYIIDNYTYFNFNDALKLWLAKHKIHLSNYINSSIYKDG